MTDSPEKRWQTILALILSALGILYFLLQAFGIGIFWLVSLFDTQTGTIENVSNSLLVWASLLSALLLIPTLWLSINRLRDKPAPVWLDGHKPWIRTLILVSVLVWPAVIALGWLIAGNPGLAVFILGPVNILVAVIPVVSAYFLAQRKLSAGSIDRKWRIFGFSLTITPFLIIILEGIALLAVGVLIFALLVVLASVFPTFAQTLTDLSDQLANIRATGLTDEMLNELLTHPMVIFGLLAAISGLVPMIEEILKPIALWSLLGRNLTDQEGFVAGLLSGAGFALMENLLYFTNVATSQDWLTMAIGRAGTGVLHMFGSGLVGWGLARAWRKGKWPFLGLMLVLAITTHGVWNALAMAGGVAPELVFGSDVTVGQQILFYLPLLFLLLLQVLILYLINRHFQKTQSASENVNLNQAELELPNPTN
ncbi:MAG: PrsW family intramembrane metalloprotease [Anaerolineaceae bacterium]|nr:PrsW family intramembrane metalloprotease [Anaerolineaceae bacterium]